MCNGFYLEIKDYLYSNNYQILIIDEYLFLISTILIQFICKHKIVYLYQQLYSMYLL